MKSTPPKRRRSFINRFAPKSIAYELMIWFLFWGLYSLWAGYSPSYPKSSHSEPLLPLVVLGFMSAFFFLFGDRNELKLLLANSVLAFLLVPGFLVLNVYRAFSGRFPDAWAEAGLLGSRYIFFFIQAVFLFLSLCLIHYTYTRWKSSEFGFNKGFYLKIIPLLIVFLLLLALILFFIFPG